MENKKRESLSSHLGFILLSAGCAIGLGNIWRFPYICGKHGGAIFVLIYLFFLIILGFPTMVMELAIGRGGKSSLIGAYRNLQGPDSRIPWPTLGKVFFLGNLVLLMFYTVITGWLLSYTWDFLTGQFNSNVSPEAVGKIFTDFQGNYQRQILFVGIVLAMTIGICISGLQNGIERVTKIMMVGLFLLIIFLVFQANSLENSKQGLLFLLKPNITHFKENGVWEGIHAAMTQAFFTLSLGIGSIAIFGSYIDKAHSLSKEATTIIFLDTFVAISSGVIIFPCCFAFNVNPDAGPSLIFITLPRIFLRIQGTSLQGTIFFLFLFIAALTTLIAVTENIIAFCIDELKYSRIKATLAIGFVLFITSLPCIFGFNLWENFHPLGKGTNILDLEDFIVSDNLLPLGALALVIFCTKGGWGIDNFYKEANAGHGFKLPHWLHGYFSYVLPTIIFAIWIVGIIRKFC